jgi:hypothetical protein
MRKLLAASAAPLILLAAGQADGAIVELTVSGFWSAGDFDVSPTQTMPSSGVPEEDDDQVFGVAPSDGSTTFILRVDTTQNTGLFPAGYLSNGANALTHDMIGYTDVELVGGSHSFGDATWNSANILTGLIQVDGLGASLWVDRDLTTGDPSKIRFRMLSSSGDITADLFVGADTTETGISDSFSIAEYFAGESLYSSSGYRGTVPAPGAAGLLALAAGVAIRRRR